MPEEIQKPRKIESYTKYLKVMQHQISKQCFIL